MAAAGEAAVIMAVGAAAVGVTVEAGEVAGAAVAVGAGGWGRRGWGGYGYYGGYGGYGGGYGGCWRWYGQWVWVC